MSLIDNIDKSKLPEHIAIIMDGNGRWAKKQGKERIYGHEKGVVAVKNITEAAAEIGIKYLTLYAFSKENWNRPQNEVNALMELLVNTINNEAERLHKNNIRLLTIGDLNSLPNYCYQAIIKNIKKTAKNKGLTLIIAISYSARWEIAETMKIIAEKVKNNKINIEEINEDIITNNLNTKNIPEPELLIRTSGENRISNFLLWQIAYTELYFTKKLWPNFRRNDFFKAIIDFQKRERRFGLTSEQII